MVNVHIHQFAGSAPVDAHAMEQFQKQWASYQKLVDNDYVSHREVGDLLSRALNERFAEPFAILDIACGDASLMKRVLPETKVSHYHGIDLAEPALELAARNLEELGFAVDLDRRDFVAAMNDRPEPADVSWCSLSIHHLVIDDKIRLLRAIRAATNNFVMIYEPTRREGEDRPAFLDRFCAVNRPLWKELTTEEWNQIESHVRTSDLPETRSGWIDAGRQAGYSGSRVIYTDPTDMFCLYRYDV
ncbi:MAG: class I SAM-dependent methyltransferase [Rhizobiales bacterium]|nr:class I SAM-dependent methyltransferase [Hyphomicrobiales bacterium]